MHPDDDPVAFRDPSPSDLFLYLPNYRVLVCRTCQYAVLPRALPVHLKEIHRITRKRRDPYLRLACGLDLATNHEDVPCPSKDDQFPVPGLPVGHGFSCAAPDCGHLCAHVVRMRAHWSKTHGRQAIKGYDFKPVMLQTFFSGGHVKYFSSPRIQPSRQALRFVPVNSDARKADDGPKQDTGPVQDDRADEDAPPGEDPLLDHWVCSTAYSFSRDLSFIHVWRDVIPSRARNHSFLLESIQAIAAHHMAYLHPTSASQWRFEAHKHQDNAFAGFHQATAAITEHNAEAIFAFAHLLPVYVFASEKLDGRSNYLSDANTESGAPMWLHLLRGGCSMLCDHWEQIETGPMEPLANIWQEPSSDVHISYEGADDALRNLRHLEQQFTHLISPTWSPPEVEAYKTAGSLLIRAFYDRITHAACTTSPWQVLQIWPWQLPDEMMHMLNASHPGALVLLAHYCVLIKGLERQFWFIDGVAGRLLEDIRVKLRAVDSMEGVSRREDGWEILVEGLEKDETLHGIGSYEACWDNKVQA